MLYYESTPEIIIIKDKEDLKNKTSKKYDILMIVWGLSLGVIELLLIHLDFFDMINIPFIKTPYAKNLLILAIISLCFRVITYFIQQPYKQNIENKNKIMRACMII